MGFPRLKELPFISSVTFASLEMTWLLFPLIELDVANKQMLVPGLPWQVARSQELSKVLRPCTLAQRKNHTVHDSYDSYDPRFYLFAQAK